MEVQNLINDFEPYKANNLYYQKFNIYHILTQVLIYFLKYKRRSNAS